MSNNDGAAAPSAVERIKQTSRGLRGTLAEELASEAPDLSEASRQLLKFHGSYEQEDRDVRRQRKAAGLEPAWQFMTRSRIPGGSLTAAQYLAHDALAKQFGNGTLRVTTRQTIQLHGIIKQDLRNTIRALNDSLVSTLATCGDIGRNVTTCPAPLPGGLRTRALELARALSDHLLPRTRAYHEIWLDGERLSDQQPEAEPLYGSGYMPRKFKAALGFADDNCVDLLTNDLGFLVVAERGGLRGLNVLVGGSLGQTHGKADTYPRLADALGFTAPEQVLEVASAVMAVQRDHGNRVDRRQARLKYLIDARGLEWFREQVETRLGRRLAPPADVHVHRVHDHLGWHRQEDGLWFRGVFVQSGRIRDDDDVHLRTALRRLLETHVNAVHLTPQQNVLLLGIPAVRRPDVDGILADHGVPAPAELLPVRRWSMACPALPTCGLAVAESERVMPGVLAALESTFTDLGIERERITVRMTGCPNGCARPYTAELSFVGRSLGKYVVMVGGNAEGTRLARKYRDLVPLDDLVDTVRPLLQQWRDGRRAGEAFGDFWDRVGLDAASLVDVAP